jgi:hypothetical protein
MANPAPNQQVSWWCVHEYVATRLAAVETWPMLGTPEWCSLDDDDPRKLVALLDGAQHYALRLEVQTELQAKTQASQAISAAADWGAVGRRLRDHNEFYTARPWLKRVPA